MVTVQENTENVGDSRGFPQFVVPASGWNPASGWTYGTNYGIIPQTNPLYFQGVGVFGDQISGPNDASRSGSGVRTDGLYSLAALEYDKGK